MQHGAAKWRILFVFSFLLTACTGLGSDRYTVTGLTVEENVQRYGIPAQAVPFDHPVPDGLLEDRAEKQVMIEAKLAHLREVNGLFWGEAPGEAEDRQATFDEVWDAIDQAFPGFAGLELDWDAFRRTYRQRIGEAQSYGDYAAILTQMGYVLKEHHAYIVPGRWAEAERSRFWHAITERVTIPALVLRRGNGTTATSTIGACLTVTLEDELIVDGIWEGSPNPYLLQVGDEIAGFNGVPWQEWIGPLETANLPIIGSPGGAEPSRRYRLLRSALMNAHLFESIQVRRQATGEVETMDTVYLDPDSWRPCLEATAPAGLVTVDGSRAPVTLDDDPMFVYGILPDEQIGYMAIKRALPGEMDTLHHPDAQAFANQFEAAVLSLMDTEGLIIDLRYNEGGRDLDIFFPGLAHLIDESEERLVFEKSIRDEDGLGRNALTELATEHGPIRADEPNLHYESPIIVLTGPGCKNSCDWLVQLLARFPEFTLIGRDPNGSMMAYGIKARTEPRGNDYAAMYVPAVALYDVEEQSPAHRSRMTGFVEEEVWSTRDDVVAGVDRIIERAIELIRSDQDRGS
jgi:hypothetical protein